MTIDATNLHFKQLNEQLRAASGKCRIIGCSGQRFIAAGMNDKNITIDGVPGNALGAYLGDCTVTVNGNAQDAVGDTMNAGEIIVHGNIGDAAGYAMRGGQIFIRGNAGYRAGIHIKEYKDKKPVIVIGGRAGSFLGEYQAGGIIIALGLNGDNKPVVGNFPCTGMHGGKMFLRGKLDNVDFPLGVVVSPSSSEDMQEISHYLKKFCTLFGYDLKTILDSDFTTVTPSGKNPYKQMYVMN